MSHFKGLCADWTEGGDQMQNDCEGKQEINEMQAVGAEPAWSQPTRMKDGFSLHRYVFYAEEAEWRHSAGVTHVKHRQEIRLNAE